VCVTSQLSWSSIAPVSRSSQVGISLKPWYFPASSFQLLKLENLLWRSLFTFKKITIVKGLSLTAKITNICYFCYNSIVIFHIFVTFVSTCFSDYHFYDCLHFWMYSFEIIIVRVKCYTTLTTIIILVGHYNDVLENKVYCSNGVQ